jgi:Ribosomal protein L24e
MFYTDATRISSKMVVHFLGRIQFSNSLVRMKRNPRKVRWTKAFRKAAGKEMVIVRIWFFFSFILQFIYPYRSQDSTIDFEKRRNVPVRYDRELMQTTIHAMKRVAEVKKRREHAFWKNRYSICCHVMNEVAEHSPGWLQAGKNSKPIGRSYRKVELLSAYSNHLPINYHPRRSKQKSGIPKSPGVLLLLERVDLWLWRPTNQHISWWCRLSVFDLPIRR